MNEERKKALGLIDLVHLPKESVERNISTLKGQILFPFPGNLLHTHIHSFNCLECVDMINYLCSFELLELFKEIDLFWGWWWWCSKGAHLID